MGCPSKVEIGENLTFSICTHDPDSGVLTDADAAPSYRVYEDEVATPILTGAMAKLDDGNTTGFYVETIACTAVNGFENGKTYTIYIEATVDSDTGGISFSFKAWTALNDITVADIIAGVTDGSYDLQEMMRIIFAVCAGKSSGGGTTALKFRNSGDSKNRVSATVDANGNRTAVTLDAS